MSPEDVESAAAIDFAVAACRDEGRWTVSPLPPRAATDLDLLVQALGQLPSDVGTIGMVSVDEDFFLLARVVAGGDVRLMLSDVGAATESPLALSVLERLMLPAPDDDDDQIQPAGDLSILSDLGLSAMELGSMCDDEDLYPDEILTDVADRVGFGPDFEDLLDSVLA
jgi:putative tRNA adenosine deaminase-associated protein